MCLLDRPKKESKIEIAVGRYYTLLSSRDAICFFITAMDQRDKYDFLCYRVIIVRIVYGDGTRIIIPSPIKTYSE